MSEEDALTVLVRGYVVSIDEPNGLVLFRVDGRDYQVRRERIINSTVEIAVGVETTLMVPQWLARKSGMVE